VRFEVLTATSTGMAVLPINTLFLTFPLVQPGLCPVQPTPVSTTIFPRARVIYHHDDGGSTILRNVGQYPPDYTVIHSRRQPSSLLTCGMVLHNLHKANKCGGKVIVRFITIVHSTTHQMRSGSDISRVETVLTLSSRSCFRLTISDWMQDKITHMSCLIKM
jgi:hypothetical protein